MFFEKSSRNPLINCESNVQDQETCPCLISFNCSFNSFEEEFDKTFK